MAADRKDQLPRSNKLLKDVALLGSRTAIARVIQIPVFLATTRALGPEAFGLLKIIQLAPTIEKFGNLAFSDVPVREARNMLDSQGKLVSSQVRDVSFSASILWMSILAVAVSVYAFFQTEKMLVIGLLMAAVTMLLQSLQRLHKVNRVIERDFSAIAVAETLAVIASGLFVVSVVWFLGIYAVLIGGMLAPVVAMATYRRRRGLEFVWSLDCPEVVRQLRFTSTIVLSTLVYGVWLWSERLLVANLLGLEALGVYMIIIVGIEMVQGFLATISQAISVRIYHHLGDSSGPINKDVCVLPTSVLAVAIPLSGGLIFILGPSVISYVLPAYSSALEILSYAVVMLWCAALPLVYATAAVSVRVNRLRSVVLLRGACLVIFTSLSIIAAKSGYGIEGIAAARTLTLAIMMIGFFLLCRSVLHPSRGDAVRAAICFIAPAVLAFVAYQLANFLVSHAVPYMKAVLQALAFLILYAPALYWLDRHTHIARIVISLIRGTSNKNA
jgi:O-antigen/teichoic acid export membrane protein